MASGGESKQLSHPLTFSRFSDLATELRIQIWQHALDSAATNRAIPVAINHHPAVILHSCLPVLGSFCGQHSNCPSYDPDSGQPVSSVVCMFNGYFSLPTHASDIEDNALRNLSLACTESRSLVLLRYPELMTVYKQTWFPGVESHPRRQVRCNPATDTLLVTAVPSYPSEQRHPSPSLNDPGDLYHQDIEKWFPQDAAIFASFRYMVSRFRNVAFSFLNDLQTPRPLLFSRVFDSAQFKQFLIIFEHLEHIYLCSNPEYLASVREWERVEHIGDRSDGSMGNIDLPDSAGVSTGILNFDHAYSDYVRMHCDLSAGGGGCCWVPVPKGFGGSWLFGCRDVFDKKWLT